jgi:hypothetical protein
MDTTRNLAEENQETSEDRDKNPTGKVKKFLDKVCETPVIKESQLCEDDAQIP